MAFNDGVHKVGDKVWVYAFNRMGGKTGRIHSITPQLGLIVGYHGIEGLEQDLGNLSFNKIVLYKKKNGRHTSELSSNSTNLLQAKIASTYEEAVEEYNKLVKEEADFYRQKYEQVRGYLIAEE